MKELVATMLAQQLVNREPTGNHVKPQFKQMAA